MNALCQMTGVSRAGFYRWRMPRQTTPVEMEIHDQMQRVALESPAYGYRRITWELQRPLRREAARGDLRRSGSP